MIKINIKTKTDGRSCLTATRKDIGKKVICIQTHGPSLTKRDGLKSSTSVIPAGTITTIKDVYSDHRWRRCMSVERNSHVRWKGFWRFYDED